jgi:predicted nucleic acid-binding protein
LIVVDASVLTDFLLSRPTAVDAVEQGQAGSEQRPLAAPDLIESETLNALRKLVLRRDVSEPRASEAVGALASVRMIRFPFAPLRERVWDLRHNLTAYDAAYLALTEALPEASLLTGDAGLAQAARDSLGEAGVRLVA